MVARKSILQSSRVLPLFVVVLMLMDFSTGVDAVLISEDTPLDPGKPPERKFCVALSTEESTLTCSADPMRLRVLTDAPEIVAEETDLGVAQRIDGNDSEKKAIREVLRLMNMYLHEEVLSNNDYESVRTTWCVENRTNLLSENLIQGI